jgi:four helix bundle protein
MSKESILRDKSFEFAVRVIKLFKYLKKQHREEIIARQVIRCGTSVGASLREAEYAESNKDFIHKLYVALKEVNECIYWLDLLFRTEYINKRMLDSMKKDGEELLKMLITSIKTSKGKPGMGK